MPASLARRAHEGASNSTGLNRGGYFSYSATGTLSLNMCHSPLPAIAYTPQWMNIPKRASRHQCMRASRSAVVSWMVCAEAVMPGANNRNAVVVCAITLRILMAGSSFDEELIEKHPGGLPGLL